MKRLIFSIALLFSLSHASATYQGIYFDDYEVNATTYLITYYPYSTFMSLNFSSVYSQYIIDCRNSGTPTLSCLNSKGFTSGHFNRIREQSHLIDWNIATNSLGITDRDYHFLMAFSAVLIGFVFLFFLLYTVVKIATRRGY